MPDELVLLVDDEPSIRELARIYLEREGFAVEHACDGEAALSFVERRPPDLMVLDIMLPKVDGFDVCKRLRTAGRDFPILMLTARDEDIDKIVGLELGADDYLTKPFNPRELVARIKAILRRSARPVQEQPGMARAGALEMDPLRREARLGSRSLDLRTQEFELLLVLAGQPGRVFTREQLLKMAWGFDFYGQTRTVDVHVAHLRRKLGGGSVRIETVPGVGYKLIA